MMVWIGLAPVEEGRVVKPCCLVVTRQARWHRNSVTASACRGELRVPDGRQSMPP